MDEWPRPFHPVADGEPDTDVTVEVFLHRPDLTDQLLAWAGGDAADVLLINGGPTILLPGTRRAADRLVGLGDYAVKEPGHSVKAEQADGFSQRFVAVED